MQRKDYQQELRQFEQKCNQLIYDREKCKRQIADLQIFYLQYQQEAQKIIQFFDKKYQRVQHSILQGENLKLYNQFIEYYTQEVDFNTIQHIQADNAELLKQLTHKIEECEETVCQIDRQLAQIEESIYQLRLQLGG